MVKYTKRIADLDLKGNPMKGLEITECEVRGEIIKPLGPVFDVPIFKK